MSSFILSKDMVFPPPDSAGDDGLLAIGGDLSVERLLVAYRQGIFPWYNEDDIIAWWFPNPRLVLFPGELNISRSMRTVINNGTFQFTINTSFDSVIINCSKAFRKDQSGTWLSPDVIEAYTSLHSQGHAHSAEAWHKGELVGGLYGVLIGKVFFGESMFSKKNNASKFAFIKYVTHLQKQGIQLIDCQVYTPHLESLGARMISKSDFAALLKQFIN